ncbi:MAG: hypothetical protein DHS20C06_13250 [Hyphobacterium sp.]|nr:MAG: hypothetical protein DHS20C06_13250 [Hyphobacterium sp.]
MVYNLTLPITVLTGLTVWSFVANATVTAFVLASITGAMVLTNWFFFLRAATTVPKAPKQMPEYRAGWSVPLRFQPEIRWQAISLSARAVGFFIVFILTMAALVSFLQSVDSASGRFTTLFRVFFIGFLLGMPIVIPPGALLSSRYGIGKSGRLARDSGLPIFLIRRREAAIEALRKKWPDAVPVEEHNLERTVCEDVEDDPMHAVKATLASFLAHTLNYAAGVTVFISSIWFANGQMEWEFSDALAPAIVLTLAFGWIVNWKLPLFENLIRRRVFKIPALERGTGSKRDPAG